MPQNIGRFEILSEIASGDFARVYKATDPDSNQTIALKVLQAQLPADQNAQLIQEVLAEADTTKSLSSQNIAVLYGAGEIDGQLCAATEYVQGKSVAGMLAQGDTFSMWDLMDIARQACQGLDHAHARKAVHCTLEPSKLLVTWDGTVKILGFGISRMGSFAAHVAGPVPETLRYMSPEQLQGQEMDARSNLFSLGAILYEMVTSRKAFSGSDADQVRQEIMMGTPTAPAHLTPRLQPGLNEVIMRALAKSPEHRYQSGIDLINDLEACKETVQKAAPRKMPQVAPRAQEEEEGELTQGLQIPQTKASAAAAGVGSVSQRSHSGLPANATMSSQSSYTDTYQDTETSSPANSRTGAASSTPAANGNGAKRPSFSDMDSLPPLKEVHVTHSPDPEPEIVEIQPNIEMKSTVFNGSLAAAAEAEKDKTPPIEIAKKAVAEIKKTPPKLFLYSIGGAACVILLVIGVIFSRIHSDNGDDSGPAVQPAAAASVQTSNAPAPVTVQPALPMVQAVPVNSQPETISIKPKRAKQKVAKVAPPPVVASVPGQLSISSTPGGAQVLVDGHHNDSWLTPFDLAGLTPGQHLVSVSKAGYATENRTIDVTSGSKSFLVIQLAPLGATALISSVPTGAQVFMDGRDTGRSTPAQVSVEKLGSHIFTVRKEGYLEESTTTTLQAGQSFQYAPVLRALGMTADIKLGGKFKKMFGGGDLAGTGVVSLKTQPKGAQVSVNRQVLDKGSPVDFYLNPGTYMIDITLSGYKDVHKVISVDKGAKVVIDETLEKQ